MVIGDSKHYSAGNAEFVLGGKSTGLKNLNVIFDSGSSYTYFNSQVYHALISMVSFIFFLTTHKLSLPIYKITIPTSSLYTLDDQEVLVVSDFALITYTPSIPEP